MKLFQTAFFVFFLFSNIAFAQKFSDELSKLPIIKGCEKFESNSNTIENLNCISKRLAKQITKDSGFEKIYEELFLYDYPISEKTAIGFVIDEERKIVDSRSYIRQGNVLLSIYGLKSFNRVKKKFNENGYVISSAYDLENKLFSVDFRIPIHFIIEDIYPTKWKKVWKKIEADRLLIKQGGSLKLYLLKSDNSFLLTKNVNGQEKGLQIFKNRNEIQYSEFLYELLDALEVQNYTSDNIIKNLEYHKYLIDNGYTSMIGTQLDKCKSKIELNKLWTLNISNLGGLQDYYLSYNKPVKRKKIEKCYNEGGQKERRNSKKLIVEKNLDNNKVKIYRDTKQSKLVVYKVLENNEEELIKEFSYLYELKDTPYERLLFRK